MGREICTGFQNLHKKGQLGSVWKTFKLFLGFLQAFVFAVYKKLYKEFSDYVNHQIPVLNTIK